jgi:hypothetical protein
VIEDVGRDVVEDAGFIGAKYADRNICHSERSEESRSSR